MAANWPAGIETRPEPATAEEKLLVLVLEELRGIRAELQALRPAQQSGEAPKPPLVYATMAGPVPAKG